MPTRTYVVPGCVNRGQVHFSFPADCKVRADWMRFLILCDNQFNDFVPGKEDCICQDHFISDDFKNYGAFLSGHCSTLTKNPGAVPSCQQAVALQTCNQPIQQAASKPIELVANAVPTTQTL